ncbi:MAG: AAA family ATPase [bacterium]|nr:AAA family ATPase [bacterium]
MYLDRISLDGIKCFKNLELEFQHCEKTNDPQSNWNVIIGNNGNGKSTILRMIAVSQLDVPSAGKLVDMNNLVRVGMDFGSLHTEWVRQQGDVKNGTAERDRVKVKYFFVREGATLGSDKEHQYFSSAQILEPTPVYKKLFPNNYKELKVDLDFLKEYVWKKENSGWLCCGYGPHRRTSGWSMSTERLKEPDQDRFLTLFEEGAALFECEEWLKELERLALRNGGRDSSQQRTFDEVKKILADILPDVSEIIFEEKLILYKMRGAKLKLEQLSDGYRSMFVFIVDLLRRIEIYRPRDVFLREAGGVVLVDEIDAHLHPSWQRDIGFILTEIFPNIQFIVTSHSTYVAMSAGKGALHVLDILENEDKEVAIRELGDSRGWAIERVLSDAFGMSSFYSQVIQKKLDDYENLYFLKKSGRLTDPKEQEKLRELKQELDTLMNHDERSPQNNLLEEDLDYLAQELKKRSDQ